MMMMGQKWMKKDKNIKKELIKLYINNINNINLEDEEITKMVELILNIKDGSNDLDSTKRKFSNR